MSNRRILLIVALMLSTNFSNSTVIGVGQVGDKYVYKINGILVSLTPGNVIDGCVIKAGSGLECNSDNLNIQSGTDTDIVKKYDYFLARSGELEIENRNLKKQLVEMNRLRLAIKNIKKNNIKSINKKNIIINRLSSALNNRKNNNK